MSNNKPTLPIWAIILIILISTVASIFAYHFYVNKNIEKMAKTHIEQIAGERDKSEQAAIDQALKIERLRNAVNSAAGLKLDITVYMADMGEEPLSLADLGHDPDFLPSDVLQSIELSDGAQITLHLRKDLGLDGRVTITPDIFYESGYFAGIRGWGCVSPDFDFINKAVPSCRYAP